MLVIFHFSATQLYSSLVWCHNIWTRSWVRRSDSSQRFKHKYKVHEDLLSGWSQKWGCCAVRNSSRKESMVSQYHWGTIALYIDVITLTHVSVMCVLQAIFHSTVDVDDSPLLQLPMQEVSLSLKRRSTTVHNEGYSVSNMFAFLLSPPTHHQQTFVNTFLLSYQLFTNGHEVLSFLSETHQKEVEQKTNHDVSTHTLWYYTICSTQSLQCKYCFIIFSTWITRMHDSAWSA